MGSLEVRYLRAQDEELWRQLLQHAKAATVYSSTDWLNAIEEVFGWPARRLAAFDSGRIVGGIGLNVRDVRGAGLFLAPPTLTAYNSFLVLPRTSDNQRKVESHDTRIIDALCSRLERDYVGADLINHPEITDIRPFQWRGWADRTYYTYLVDLSDLKCLWEAMFNDVRSKVRKGQKSGFTFGRYGSAKQFYRLWSQTFEKQGITAPVDEDRLKHLFDILEARGILTVYESCVDGEVASMIAVLKDNERSAHEWQATTSARYLETGVFAFSMWSVMEDLAELGFRQFDLDGAGLKSIAFSKNQFGGRLAPHYRVWKMRPKGAILMGLWRASKRLGFADKLRRVLF